MLLPPKRARIARSTPTLWEEPPPTSEPLELVVLASSSAGNCSILLRGEGRRRRVTLLDAGISPLRVRRYLATLALDLDRIDDLLLTHLDHDHCHPGWIRALPPHAKLRISHRHRGRASRAGLLKRRTEIFTNDPFTITGSLTVTPVHLAHDDLGVVAFRIDLPTSENSTPTSLGYATDLGRPTHELTSTLAAVDVLAIESNYCPHLQAASDRPEFVKRRITDGSGHLSNEQCAQAVSEIAPKREVVLLHLSRQCNTPERAAEYHNGAPYRLTIAHHQTPTNPIPIHTPVTI